MAFMNFRKGLTSIWKVNGHTVDPKDVIGKGLGAYGIVYNGKSSKKESVAAKMIDGKEHPRIADQNFDKILQLSHPNIVKIFDIEHQDDAMWIFMEYCGLGDLNAVFHTRNFLISDKLDIMNQIAQGIESLHKYNIIHRDIKPGNILVAGDSPLLIKITDFDVSKILDPEILTSVMSSNVGTLAFKAPEFFQRNARGEISYHRRVDIYASGLTFLAMIQAKEKCRMLVPQIETPMDHSELHVPIGSLIAERIKYKVPELNVVVTTHERDIVGKVRNLIREMTQIKPEERLSAADVVIHVATILQQAIEKQKVSAVSKEQDHTTTQNSETRTQIKMTWHSTWTTKMAQACTMCVNTKGQILMHREHKTDQKWYIRVADRKTGAVVREIRCECDHLQCFREVHSDPNYIVEGCAECQLISLYNIKTKAMTVVSREYKPRLMCDGPEGTLLVLHARHEILRLNWDPEKQELTIIPIIKIQPMFYRKMCYEEQNDFIVMTSYPPGMIKAVRLSNGEMEWEVAGLVDGKEIKPYGICSDTDGRIFVADGQNSRVMVFYGQNGEFIKSLLTEERMGDVFDVCWTDTQPQLNVRHGEPKQMKHVTCFNM